MPLYRSDSAAYFYLSLKSSEQSLAWSGLSVSAFSLIAWMKVWKFCQETRASFDGCIILLQYLEVSAQFLLD